MKKVIRAIEEFFLAPASPLPLAALRVGVVAVLLIQAFMLRGSVLEFFAHDGLVQGDLAQYLSTPNVPRLSWLVDHGIHWGISESGCIYAFCWTYFISLLCLGLGLWTRTAAILSWLFHWILTNSGYSTTYGVDLYAHVFLFYLMVIPCGAAYSVDCLARGRVCIASSAARLGLRVVQIHLCISYLCSGIEKAQGAQWWNGELLWRALSLPVYRQFDMNWLARWPYLAQAGGWMTLILELGYCVFIWPKATRKIWIAGILSLHIGIAVFLGLGLFGAVMCVFTFCAFGLSAEPNPQSLEEGTVAKTIGHLNIPLTRELTRGL